jgi:hypothetical protein
MEMLKTWNFPLVSTFHNEFQPELENENERTNEKQMVILDSNVFGYLSMPITYILPHEMP